MAVPTITGTTISSITETTAIGCGNITASGGTIACRGIDYWKDGQNTFCSGTGFNGDVCAIAIQSDTKVIVGGVYTSYSGVSAGQIIRLNSTGSIDSSFDVGAGFNGDDVFTIAIQSDNKIVVGGYFTTFDTGSSINRIVRLNSNGSIDTGFTTVGFDNDVTALLLQSDNKIVVGGGFSTYDTGTTANYIARLCSNGTFDTGFTASFDSSIYALAPQGNKILVGGGFTTYDTGTTANYIARLCSNGTFDTGFTTGTGFDGSVCAIAIQNDGKILAAGCFTAFDGGAFCNIARLCSNGCVDNTFVVDAFINGGIQTISVQADCKIVIGGRFNGYGNILRLNSNGSIDDSWFIEDFTGFNSCVNTTAIETNNKILAGGHFTSYTYIDANHYTELNSDGTIYRIALSSTTGDTGIFITDLTGLTSNTLYHAQAFAANGDGNGYGNIVSFTTLAGGVIEVLTSTGYRFYLRTDIGDADAIEAQLQAIAIAVDNQTNANY
ncbi:MAG: hypothetical protein EHM34_02165 [Nitrosopumilales archaeon]|nr:MAG: hypothetical protein EHM34_02165 [Nitrosopumilales archaeon]